MLKLAIALALALFAVLALATTSYYQCLDTGTESACMESE